MRDRPRREPHMGPRCEWCEQPFQEGEDHHAGIDCVQALQRRHEPRREPRMGPRCEWCGRPFQEGQDHHERMDCIQALQCRLEAVAQELALLLRIRRQWVLTEHGTNLLKSLGWTPPADWWTYGPEERVPLARPVVETEPSMIAEQFAKAREASAEASLSMIAERLAKAREARPADVYTLLAEIRELQGKLDFEERLLQMTHKTNEPLIAIAVAAWDCFHLEDPPARMAAAERLAKALAGWKGRNKPLREHRQG
jgi:hypothetical protein